MRKLEYEQQEPAGTANSAVIWLHGLGADGHDFVPVVPHLKLPEGTETRFIFPHAEQIPVTVNGGMRMRAWYDILEMNIDRSVDESQLRTSAQATVALIEQQIEQGIPADRIVVAGFSQGGAVAYEAGLTYPQRLAGVMALSTYLATQDSLEPHAAQADLPVFVAHGSMDPIVPQQLGEQAKDWLQQRGYQVTWHSYPMAHQVCAEQLQDISRWLQQVLPAPQ